MALDQKFRRFALLMESEIGRMLEKQAAATRGADEVRPDAGRGLVSYLHQGAVLWQARVEKIADYQPELGIFRWWFHGFEPDLDRVRLGLAFREGERWAMSDLTKEQLILDDGEAELICRVAAQLARADGILRAPNGGHVLWYALYDARDGGSARPTAELRDTHVTRGSERPAWMVEGHDVTDTHTGRGPGFKPAVVGSSHSVPPPPAMHRTGPIAQTRPTLGVRSLGPSHGVSLSDDPMPAIPPPPRAPQVAAPVREIKREIFMPVVQSALAEVVQSVSDFSQALLVVRIDAESGKGRFIVQLVASDSLGSLHALDPSKTLVDAVGKMVGEDARDGNGRWKKLVARLRHTERGAAVEQQIG